MDDFLENDLQEAMLWLEEDYPIVNQGAFVRYTHHQAINWVAGSSGNINMNKRMIQFLNKSWAPQVNNEKERVYKHMINERLRRDKQRQNYLALHKLLPLGTKGDKNSIIQMATKRIEELQKYKNELKKQNYGLEMRLKDKSNNVPVCTKTNGSSREVERAHITLNVASPSSGVDSMLEVLRSLKSTNDTRTIAIQSCSSAQTFSARLEIETKIGVAEVEKVVNTTLWEVEKKYRINPSEIQPYLPRNGPCSKKSPPSKIPGVPPC